MSEIFAGLGGFGSGKNVWVSGARKIKTEEKRKTYCWVYGLETERGGEDEVTNKRHELKWSERATHLDDGTQEEADLYHDFFSLRVSHGDYLHHHFWTFKPFLSLFVLTVDVFTPWNLVPRSKFYTVNKQKEDSILLSVTNGNVFVRVCMLCACGLTGQMRELVEKLVFHAGELVVGMVRGRLRRWGLPLSPPLLLGRPAEPRPRRADQWHRSPDEGRMKVGWRKRQQSEISPS